MYLMPCAADTCHPKASLPSKFLCIFTCLASRWCVDPHDWLCFGAKAAASVVVSAILGRSLIIMTRSFARLLCSCSMIGVTIMRGCAPARARPVTKQV